jgi:hypothetical protein
MAYPWISLSRPARDLRESLGPVVERVLIQAPALDDRACLACYKTSDSYLI